MNLKILIQRIINNKYLFLLLNVLIFTLLFLHILFKLRFSIIVNDDLTDIISSENIEHGRIITGFISLFFVKILPEILNIPYNDFAFFSESILKSVSYIILVYLTANVIYKFSESPCYKRSIGLWGIFIYFLLFSILFLIDFVWSFDTLAFSAGYIFSNIFFILFWLKLFDFYFYEKKHNKIDLFILILVTFGNTCANEMLDFAGTVLLLLLLLESLLQKHIHKNNNININYILISFITVFIFSVCSYLFSTFDLSLRLWDCYNLSLNFIVPISTIKFFIIIFWENIIINNIYLLIPYIICIISIYFCGNEKQNNIKVIKFIMYSTIGFIVFIIGTMFLPANCYFTHPTGYNFWFLHPGVLFTFNYFIFVSTLFMLGYLKYNTKTKLTYVVSICIILFSGLIFIHKNYKHIENYLLHPYSKQQMYQNDKMAILYLKKGRTIILPKNQLTYLIPDIDPSTMSSNPIFYTKIYIEESSYLDYIRKQYKLDTTPGLTFRDDEEAFKEYFNNGGTFTSEELKEIKFSKIKKDLEKQKN